MSPELNNLRDELAKFSGHETSQLRGIIADIIKDKKVQKLLLYCVQEGILQEFLQKTEFDHFFIITSKRKLIEDCLVDEINAEKAISYCKFLTGKQILKERINSANDLIPYRKGNKWGFSDRNKKIQIDCIYDHVEPYSKGFAKVFIMGKRGIIDDSCNITIPVNYDSINQFDNGFEVGLEISLDKQNKRICGFFDNNGKQVVPFEYYSLISRDDFFFVSIRSNIDFYGEVQKYGLLDKFGRELVPCKYDFTIYEYKEGFAKVGKRNFGYGFIDKSGKEVIQCKYQEARDFKEGFAVVKNNNKYGFINKYGNEVVTLQYDDASDFHDGFASVALNRKWGIINKEGFEVVRCTFDEILFVKNGLAAIKKNL
ncbi:MAG: WG repeat-containing protein [Bacteroidota bacterium]|nr:WG repeat-containing protein [Bacteroidota bacterium]